MSRLAALKQGMSLGQRQLYGRSISGGSEMSPPRPGASPVVGGRAGFTASSAEKGGRGCSAPSQGRSSHRSPSCLNTLGPHPRGPHTGVHATVATVGFPNLA